VNAPAYAPLPARIRDSRTPIASHPTVKHETVRGGNGAYGIRLYARPTRRACLPLRGRPPAHGGAPGDRILAAPAYSPVASPPHMGGTWVHSHLDGGFTGRRAAACRADSLTITSW